jgi:hypothetical protein
MVKSDSEFSELNSPGGEKYNDVKVSCMQSETNEKRKKRSETPLPLYSLKSEFEKQRFFDSVFNAKRQLFLCNDMDYDNKSSFFYNTTVVWVVEDYI